MNNTLFTRSIVIIIIYMVVFLNAKDANKFNSYSPTKNNHISILNVANAKSGAESDYFNSPHNLSANSLQSNDQSGKCIICHTQSNKVDDDILWSTTKLSDSIQPTDDHPIIASAGSLKCLGCHDGASAANTLPNGSIGFTVGNEITTANSTNSMNSVFDDSNYLSQELGNNHPVGIIYDETKEGLNAIADLKIAKLEKGTNKVTCASCHEPHNYKGGSFLTVSNEGSSLCLDCHNK